MSIAELIERARWAEESARRGLDAAEETHDEAVRALRKPEAEVNGVKALQDEAASVAARVRQWLDHEVLVGLLKSEVALIERLIDDLQAVKLPARRAA